MMDFDFSSMAHRVIDGLMVGDVASILIAIGYALVAFGSTWLAAKSIKGCAKCTYHGAKWMVTPRQDSEMAQSIISKLQNAALSAGSSLTAPPVYVYCGSEKVTKPFTEIRVGGNDVSCLLTRREKKKIYTVAKAVRKTLCKEKAERDLKNAHIAAMAALVPSVKVEASRPDDLSKGIPVVEAKKADHSKDVQARNLCMCGSCVSQRNRAS